MVDMEDDEVGKPFWPLKEVLTASEVARKVGVPLTTMQWAIERMVEMGTLIPILSPLCHLCGAIVGEFLTPEDLPEDVRCPRCGQEQHISELDLRIGYVVSSPSGS